MFLFLRGGVCGGLVSSAQLRRGNLAVADAPARSTFLRGTEYGIMADVNGMDTTIGYVNDESAPIGAWGARCISVQGYIHVYIFHNHDCNLSTGHAIYMTSVPGLGSSKA